MREKSVVTQQYDLRILRALRRITRSVALYSRQLAACSNITAPQLICLRTVVDNGPLTATAISREIHVSPSTVVGILDRLEDKGLIERERGREDRRIVFVTATSAGIVLAQETPSPLQKKLADALNALPELEQAAITLSLERVVALMEPEVAELNEPAGDLISPILDVPIDGALPESGLAV
ncbi:MarR family transcriptional regulator [Alcaligenaceae bacterium]|nr:MarR family transcriptional regulator [Alcaligenaceae bacterium]